MSCATPFLPADPLGHVPEMNGHVAEIVGHDPETAGHVRPKYARASLSVDLLLATATLMPARLNAWAMAVPILPSPMIA